MSNLPVYNNNHNLKAAGVQLGFTDEQVAEYLKCAEDPLYFIENYAKVVSLDKGIVPFKPYDYQERIISSVHENRNTIVRLFRQSGKCQSHNTQIRLKNKKSGEILEISIGDFFEHYAKRA